MPRVGFEPTTHRLVNGKSLTTARPPMCVWVGEPITLARLSYRGMTSGSGFETLCVGRRLYTTIGHGFEPHALHLTPLVRY